MTFPLLSGPWRVPGKDKLWQSEWILKLLIHFICTCVCIKNVWVSFLSFFTDSPGLLSHVPVEIKILDVNDNPPELARDYDVIVCENAKPSQVSC